MHGWAGVGFAEDGGEEEGGLGGEEREIYARMGGDVHRATEVPPRGGQRGLDLARPLERAAGDLLQERGSEPIAPPHHDWPDSTLCHRIRRLPVSPKLAGRINFRTRA